MQTKKQSFIEAVSNTAVGFLISYASTFLIFPLVGIKTSPGTNLVIVIYFTVISILRGYVIRRFFNKKPSNIVENPQKLWWLHCFNCETDMPVAEDNDNMYCTNCGLKH